MIRLFSIISILLLCSSTYADEPIIGKFDQITYEDFAILPDPIAVTFIGQYCNSRGININDVKMTDIDNFIKDYANKHGMDTLMVEILDRMLKVYGKPAENFDPFPRNRGTIYAYGDDIPDVCFFPVDKARWNGYEVTAAKWSQLTDFQKTMFISEAAEEIERSEDVKVKIRDGWRLLIAINGGIAAVPKDTNFPAMRLFHDLLKMDGSIKSNNHGLIYKD